MNITALIRIYKITKFQWSSFYKQSLREKNSMKKIKIKLFLAFFFTEQSTWTLFLLKVLVWWLPNFFCRELLELEQDIWLKVHFDQ